MIMGGKRVTIAILTVVMISASLMGCLGAPEGTPEDTPETMNLGDIILESHDIPGEWEILTSSEEEYSARLGLRSISNDTRIWLSVMRFDDEDEAEEAFTSMKEKFAPLISGEPELGDECYMMRSLGYILHDIYVECRVGSYCIIFDITNYPDRLAYTEEWVLDIMECQISSLLEYESTHLDSGVDIMAI